MDWKIVENYSQECHIAPASLPSPSVEQNSSHMLVQHTEYLTSQGTSCYKAIIKIVVQCTKGYIHEHFTSRRTKNAVLLFTDLYIILCTYMYVCVCLYTCINV